MPVRHILPLMAGLIFLAISSASAMAAPTEYDIHPPTLTIKHQDFFEYVETFVMVQTLSFIGGGVIARSVVDTSLATMMVGGLIGGSLATVIFLGLEFEEHVMAPRRN